MLGYLDPDYFLGGRIKLDVGSAARARSRTPVAEPLGTRSSEARRYAILAVANEHMVAAITEITINQGVDPRERCVVAGGGAGGLTIAAIAGELGCARVLVPRTAARPVGVRRPRLATSSPSSASAAWPTRTASTTTAVNDGLAELDAPDRRVLRPAADSPPRRRRKEYFVEARYPYQVWELEVPLPSGRFDGEADVGALVEAFHATHERVFAVNEPGQRSSACTGRAARPRACPSRRWPRLARDGATPPQPERAAPSFVRARRARRDVPCTSARRSRPGERIERAGDRRGADHDRRRPPGVVADGDRAGDYLLERGARMPRRERRYRRRASIRSCSRCSRTASTAICREMTNTLLRSGRSAVLNMARDFSCSIVTADNQLLASAEGLPVHVIGIGVPAPRR